MAKAAQAVLERPEEPAPAPATAVAPVAAVPVAAVPVAPKRYRIHDRDVKRTDQTVGFDITVQPDVPFEVILNDPGFWANVVRSKNMQIGNIIHIHVADVSYFAELYIVDVGGTWAKVRLLRKVDFERQTSAGDVNVPDYSLHWDLVQKHHIRRDKDGQVIAKDFASKSEAQAALVDYVQRIGR